MSYLKKLFKYLFVFVVLLLLALPYVAKYGAVHYLENEQKMRANIDDVSINLLAGKIGLEGVHLYGEKKGELHLGQFLINLSVLELLQKNILVESVNFHDFSINIDELDGHWNVGGLHIPLPEKSEEPESDEIEKDAKPFDWGYGVRLISFSGLKLSVNSQYTDSEFVLNKLKIKDVLSWFPANNSDLELDLSVNGKSFKIDGAAKPFMSESLIKTNITIDNIQLKPFLKSVKELPFDDASVAVFSDFDLEVAMVDENIQLDIKGSYGLKDIYLKDKIREVKLEKLFWDGGQSLVLPEQGAKLINLDGLLAIENIDVKDKDNNAHILQEKVELAGEYEIKLDDNADKPKIKALASLMLAKLNIKTLDQKIDLASFAAWKVTGIKIDNIDKVGVQQSELENLVLLKEVGNKNLPAVAYLDKFVVSDVQYQPNSVAVNNIEFRKLNADVMLDKEGNIPALAVFSKGKAEDDKIAESQQIKVENQSEPDKQVEDADKNQEPPFGIELKQIIIDSNSNIRFVDNSVTPVFETKLHGLNVLVENVNSLDPEQAMSVDAKVKIDEYGQFVLKGKLNPFSEKKNANLIADLDALELVPLSSYASKFAGINIKRGTLDLDANIDIKNDILDIKNTFYMNQLNVESDEREVEDNIFKDMPMPLDLTLDVLRDKNNVIKLDIPVKGDVNKPDFRLQDVYNKAMAKAMKFAAQHYLMQAVQPLGLVITAGKLIGKATAPKFDPLVFDAGTADISDTNKGHIKKLANILQEKEKLRFTICGTATESDWKVIQASQKASAVKAAAENVGQELKDVDNGKAEKDDLRTKALLKLANDRTKLVKKHFVEAHKIAPKRLFACNGKITKDEEDKLATPSVEITL